MSELPVSTKLGRPPSRTVAWSGLVAVVVAVVAAGIWGISSPRESAGHGGAHGDEALHGPVAPIAGGFMRVEVVDEVGLKHAMPGMTAGTVPPGKRRLSVQVTLAAGAQPLRTDQDFVLRGKGASTRGTIKRQIAIPVVPAGAAATALLTFEVPERASGLRLGVRGEKGSIALPAVGSRSRGHADDGH